MPGAVVLAWFGMVRGCRSHKFTVVYGIVGSGKVWMDWLRCGPVSGTNLCCGTERPGAVIYGDLRDGEFWLVKRATRENE
jgi:hypothetical protein